MMDTPSSNLPTVKRAVKIGIIVAAYLVLTIAFPPPEGLTAQGVRAIGLMLATVALWVLEPIPLAITSVLMTIVQSLVGVAPLPQALANFANPTVFFLLGMFCFTLAFIKTGFSERLALWISRFSKGSPTRMLFCFITGGTLLSTVMADVPVIVMLAPVALKVVEQNTVCGNKSNFAKAVMIGLPMGVLMGGIATPTGASMNLLTMQFLQDMADIHMSFWDWSAIGVPVVLVLIPSVWWILTHLFPSEVSTLAGTEQLDEAWKALGPLSTNEKKFMAFMVLNITLWGTDQLHGIPLPVLGVLGGVALFLPGVDLIDWKYTSQKVNWDILLLTGCACSLSMSLWNTGAAAWIGQHLLGGILTFPVWLIMLCIGFFTLWIHIVVPIGPALIAVFMPMVIAMAQNKGINPIIFALPLGMLASASLILVIDAVQLVTYQYGYYSMKDWFKSGVIISFLWIPLTVCSILLIGSTVLKLF